MYHQINIIFIVVCTIYFKISASCAPDKNFYDVITCSYLEEVEEAGSRPEWMNLTIKNSGIDDLQTLKNDAFKNVPNLKLLVIDGLVNKFEPFAFRGLNKLMHLELNNNEIEELPENLFADLNLYYISIKNSSLKSIPSKYFIKMDNLRHIELSNNSISKIGNCAFCELQNTFIILSNNLLTSFEPDRILGQISFIKGIKLDNNQLTSIPIFGEMYNLRGASFVNNAIEEFDGDSFKNSPKLVLLDFSHNKVKELPDNIFPERIRYDEPFFLMMHYNNMDCLSRDVRIKFRALRRLTINDNPWKCQCLEDVKIWATKLNAFVGCDWPETCVISCIDSKDNRRNVSFY